MADVHQHAPDGALCLIDHEEPGMYRYTWLQAHAPGGLGEFAVLGLLVGHGKTWQVHPVGSRSRAASFCGETAVQAAEEQLDQLRLQAQAKTLDEDDLRQMSALQSTVRLSPLQMIAAETLDAAVQALLPVGGARDEQAEEGQEKTFRILIDSERPFALECTGTSLADALTFAASAPLQAWDFDATSSQDAKLDRIKKLAQEMISEAPADEPCDWSEEHDCHQVARYFVAERLLGIVE